MFGKFEYYTNPMNGYTEARSTVVGRFFAATPMHQTATGIRWYGGGHMKMYSLLVIQQVLAVAPGPSN